MTPEQEILLRKYAQAVISSPDHLTSDRDPDRFYARHIQDAVKLCAMIPPSYRKEHLRILDVGTGNGVPGVPIAILEPAWDVCLLDSDNKKSLFIDAFCKNNAINNAHVIIGRAEIMAQGAMRECHDIVFARALGKLPTALELSAAFAKVSGLIIVPHGTSWESELNASANAMDLLGLSLTDNIEYQLDLHTSLSPLDHGSFHALLFRKEKQTAQAYPRSNGKPKKRPL
jgi:16S rRNA (guanine527-N7)-methyltransferase